MYDKSKHKYFLRNTGISADENPYISVDLEAGPKVKKLWMNM